MLRALMLKELRETAWIALAGLVAHLAIVANCAGYAVVPFWRTGGNGLVPFIDGNFVPAFCFVSIALAIALGLRQAALESRGGTWLFLLHRPASMQQVLAAKLVVGAGLYLVCGVIAVLSFAAWAAIPGHHASPFRWWMTADAWNALIIITIVYLAAFLSGLRPARWFGTRLLPLAAGGPLAMLLVPALLFSMWLGIAVFMLEAACLASLIAFTAQTRDFS
jgi:hypothetical protein